MGMGRAIGLPSLVRRIPGRRQLAQKGGPTDRVTSIYDWRSRSPRASRAGFKPGNHAENIPDATFYRGARDEAVSRGRWPPLRHALPKAREGDPAPTPAADKRRQGGC